MNKPIKLYIEEEYGYREWYAELTEEEYKEVLRRWETMRGLYCSVPVKLIVPQARQWKFDENTSPWDGAVFRFNRRAHIHDHDDSFIDGSNYEIPAPIYDNDRWNSLFWIDGKSYTYQDLCDLNDKFSQEPVTFFSYATPDTSPESTSPQPLDEPDNLP